MPILESISFHLGSERYFSYPGLLVLPKYSSSTSLCARPFSSHLNPSSHLPSANSTSPTETEGTLSTPSFRTSSSILCASSFLPAKARISARLSWLKADLSISTDFLASSIAASYSERQRWRTDFQ